MLKDERRAARSGHHGGVQKGQDLPGFVQGSHRVVVTCQHHQVTTGLLELNHKAVVEFARVAGGRTGIKDIAGNDNGINLLGLRRIQQPVQKGGMFSGPALAVKVLAEMPVRGVKDAHIGSMAKKRKADYKRLGTAGKRRSSCGCHLHAFRLGQIMARRILVVEDEAPIREMVCFVLEQNGFQPVEAEDYDSAVNQLNEPWPDLILLDWMLPGGSGIQFIKHLKRENMTRDIPVMMLTARGEEEDRVRGLETGADDYITKPFSPKELVARIKAVMRRISPMAVEEVIEMQGLSLDPTSHQLMTGENPLDMGPTEFKLLHFFMTHPERVYSREQLLNHVWGTNVYVEDRTVDVHIRRLRKALELSGHDRMVQTVRGTGYRFSTRF